MPKDERLVPVFMPALAYLLHKKEVKKRAPLSKNEVIAIRDKAVCMMVRESIARQKDFSRGFPDVDPEDCWESWQEIRKFLTSRSAW